jgi:hypothetical protein
MTLDLCYLDGLGRQACVTKHGTNYFSIRVSASPLGAALPARWPFAIGALAARA